MFGKSQENHCHSLDGSVQGSGLMGTVPGRLRIGGDSPQEIVADFTLPNGNVCVMWRQSWKRILCGMKAILIPLVAVGLTCDGCRRVTVVPHAESYDGIIVHVAPCVNNMRDLGGWRTLGGGCVRTGLVYRSAALNTSDAKWYRPNWRIPSVSREYLAGKLGIRTDLDLRRKDEVAGISSSPIGPNVNWQNIPAKAYAGVVSREGREAFAKMFRLFLDRRNYPIVFHCWAGRDRAGTLAFLLNGLLGVSDADLEKDWLYTWTGSGKNKNDLLLLDSLRKALEGYSGVSTQDRIESFVKSLGFTDADLLEFKAIMLE